MTSILKKNKYMNFIIALIATVLLIFLFSLVARLFFPEPGSFFLILIPVLSGFTTTVITSYHSSFSYGFSIWNSLAVFIVLCATILFFVPILYGVILVVPLGIILVILGAITGYEFRKHQIKMKKLEVDN